MIFISKYVEDCFFLLSYYCKLSKLQKYWVEKLSQLWWTWHSKNSIDFDLDLDSYRRTCGFKRGVLWWFWRFVWVRLCGHFPCAHPFPIFIHSHNTECVGSECHQTYKSEGGINILDHICHMKKQDTWSKAVSRKIFVSILFSSCLPLFSAGECFKLSLKKHNFIGQIQDGAKWFADEESCKKYRVKITLY